MVSLVRNASVGIGVPFVRFYRSSVVAFGHGGECIALPVLRWAMRGDALPDPPDLNLTPVRQPASPATSRFGAGGPLLLGGYVCALSFWILRSCMD